MVLCEVRQCNNLTQGGHWFLKYNNKKKGFGIENNPPTYINEKIFSYISYYIIILKALISMIFINIYSFSIINPEYKGNNYTIITSFEANENEIDKIFNENTIKNKKFSYNQYNCRHILYEKIHHLLDPKQKNEYIKYLEYGKLPIFLMKN